MVNDYCNGSFSESNAHIRCIVPPEVFYTLI